MNLLMKQNINMEKNKGSKKGQRTLKKNNTISKKRNRCNNSRISRDNGSFKKFSWKLFKKINGKENRPIFHK